jgi:hypothetical protein
MAPAQEMRQDGCRMAGVAASSSSVVAASALFAACAWTSLDAVGPSLDAVDAETTGSDALVGPDASGPEDEASLGNPPAAACSASLVPARQWSFDSSIESWTVEVDTGVQATPAWSGAMGDPSPGALQIDVIPSSGDASLTGAWLHFAFPSPVDLSNSTITAWAWLDSGQSPHLKTFVQTGTMYKWADNGTLFLAPHQWTCLSLPVSMPAYAQPEYDPTKVVSIGFEMLATAPFRLFFDTVQYY